MREAVPVIDAAIMKLVRLTGGFKAVCRDPRAQEQLEKFLELVPVGGNQTGVTAFISTYFEQLLTYGTAVGEILTDSSGIPVGLYNARLEDIELRRAENAFDIELCVRDGGELYPVKKPSLVLLSVLNPEAGQLSGNSLLKGLPFVSSVLVKIFNTLGTNWDRLGNVRFAVTYKPQDDAVERAYAKERAMQVAEQWSEAMSAGASVKDFVAVGDVQIRVIGAECQMPDSDVPVKQMLEQIIAKTGLPPFMLGLSWSTTERMSQQQADTLTSELEAYRRILTPVILKICDMWLSRSGFTCRSKVKWDDITMQDQLEISKARLYDAQAEKLELDNSRQKDACGQEEND